jgi:RNA polymerase sigma-70 factor (ECF subfamily)
MTPILASRRTDRAFERMYQKHAGDVYRYALVVLRNEADAEDVTQTTFLNAYRAYARGERPRTPQNWLIAIAHNVCRQRFRQSQRRPNEVELNEELARGESEEDERVSAEDIRRALGHLAFNQRAALVMRELEGRSYQEIAEILGLSVSAVETLIFRARRSLREQLEEGITCHEAELAISRQLDGRLARNERGALRAHLRQCEDCARFARSQRAQRGAIKSLALIPLPSTLSSFFGHGGGATATASGGAALGGGIAIKAAAIGATAVVATGVGYEGAKRTIWQPAKANPAAAAVRPAAKKTPVAATTLVPEVAATGKKPLRAASVQARKHRHGRSAVLRARGREAGSLSASRGRAHNLKPAHHTLPPQATLKGQNGHHGGQTKPHKPKPQPPSHRHGGGNGQGHGGGQDKGHGGKP